MDLLKLLQDLVVSINAAQAQIAELQTKLADAEAETTKLADEKYSEGYRQGKADGEAGGGSDKIYSQEELEAAVAGAVAPLNEQIAALAVRVEELEKGQVEVAKNAVEAFKMSMKAAWEALEGKETAAEAEFAQMFEPEVVVE